MDDYSNGVEQLDKVVRDACARKQEWPARVTAGICAAIEFVVDYPDTARRLTIEYRISDFDRGYVPMVEQFSKLLAADAPPDQQLTASTEQALVGGIVTVVADHLRSGRLERLGQLAPELVYLTLLPYVGFDEAKRWADSIDSPGSAAPPV